MIQLIMQDFVSNVTPKMIIHIHIKNNGEVVLYSNYPGVLIGKQGETKNRLTIELKKYGANKVTIKDIPYLVSNCGIH